MTFCSHCGERLKEKEKERTFNGKYICHDCRHDGLKALQETFDKVLSFAEEQKEDRFREKLQTLLVEGDLDEIPEDITEEELEQLIEEHVDEPAEDETDEASETGEQDDHERNGTPDAEEEEVSGDEERSVARDTGEG